MEIKCKIKVTEGIVYNGIKEGVEAYLKVIRKALEQTEMRIRTLPEVCAIQWAMSYYETGHR